MWKSTHPARYPTCSYDIIKIDLSIVIHIQLVLFYDITQYELKFSPYPTVGENIVFLFFDQGIVLNYVQSMRMLFEKKYVTFLQKFNLLLNILY